MRLFGGKGDQQSKPDADQLLKMAREENGDLAEVMAKNGLYSIINSVIEETVKKSTDYQLYEATRDDGGFYGSEYNIRATAGRIKSTYTREPWIFATANLIARTLCSVPYEIVRRSTQDVIPNHPLMEKIKLGSKSQDAYSMNWSGYLDLILGGNYFQVFNKRYTECIHVPVEDVQINMSSEGTHIKSITVFSPESNAHGVEIPYEQVIHRKFPNPFNRFYGLSLYIAASRPVLLDRFMNEFNMAFYLRGATNAGVIETTVDVAKSRMARIMRTFEQLYTGKRNWFRTIFLPKGAKWIKSGLTMAEAQHLESLRENRFTILATLGIPPAKVGITDTVNRATSDNQDKDFWKNTIEPLAKFVASSWNNSYLVQQFYPDVEVKPDFSEIEALSGTPKEKGEHISAVKDVLWIDEIRRDILGYEELPDGKGQMFVSQVSAAAFDSFLLSAQRGDSVPLEDEIKKLEKAADEYKKGPVKDTAIVGQERLEGTLGKRYLQGYGKYVSELLDLSSYALRNGLDVRQFLLTRQGDVQKKYISFVEDPLKDALRRAFSLALSTTKSFSAVNARTAWVKLSASEWVNYREKVNEVDLRAIDILRERQDDGRVTALMRRAIESFLGFNETRTEEIVSLITDAFEEGKTADEIAFEIRERYDENYKNQAFTLARNEILTAISQGIKWNHDVLGEVFSDVEKQWFHVGDVATNPDAREGHYQFELEGPQKKGYRYGGILEFPRDTSGPAGEIINCRCTLASVIPEHAVSNAEVIIDTELR